MGGNVREWLEMANAACVGGSFLGVEKGKPATVSNLGAPAVLLLVLACLPLVLPSSDPKQGMSFGDLDGGGSAAGLQYPYGAFASSPVLSLTVVRTTHAHARHFLWLGDAGRISCG